MTKEEQYDHYLGLIAKWSKIVNLTAATHPAEIRTKHFDDSKAVIPFLGRSKTLIDIGSGAGFPGIPIKIECPDIHVSLLDSNRKKVNFLRQVVFELGLKGIEAYQGRAEDPEFFRTHGPFDAVVSRATWPLELYLELGEPYFEAGGRIIAMKGAKWQQELKTADKTIKKYGLKLSSNHQYQAAAGEKRCILVFEK